MASEKEDHQNTSPTSSDKSSTYVEDVDLEAGSRRPRVTSMELSNVDGTF